MQKNIHKYCIHSFLNELETNMKILLSDIPFVAHIIIWGQHKNLEDPIYKNHDIKKSNVKRKDNTGNKFCTLALL